MAPAVVTRGIAQSAADPGDVQDIVGDILALIPTSNSIELAAQDLMTMSLEHLFDTCMGNIDEEYYTSLVF